jgi:choline dehydrogenase
MARIMEAEFIVVGAGSAGCVLANRLSADPRNRVALLEAGGWDTDPLISIPLLAAINYFRPSLNWGYETEPQVHVAGVRMALPRGRVIGGTSSINGMVCMRGDASDFARWTQSGIRGWSWDDVLPVYKEFERILTPELDRTYHGYDGELPIVRAKGENELYPAWMDAAEQSGYSRNPDVNGATQDGISFNHFNILRGRRISAATAFLHPVKSRRNLDVITRAQVTRLLFEGRRCVGVEYRQDGHLKTMRASREVVVSGGVFNSPQILMLSGIGDARSLQRLGIEVVADRPSVGRDLQDHVGSILEQRCIEPVTLYRLFRPDRAVLALLQSKLFGTGQGAVTPLEGNVMARSREGLDAPDLQLVLVPGLSLDATAGRNRGHGYMVGVTHMRPLSRGEVTLRSADPLDKPAIQPNFLSEADDVRVIREGLKIARNIGGQRAMTRYRGPEMTPGEAVKTDAQLDDFVRSGARSFWHAVGTCRMGADGDSVVDDALRVRGVDCLRVADASIFPDIIAAGPNVPCMMIGSRAAKMMLAN